MISVGLDVTLRWVTFYWNLTKIERILKDLKCYYDLENFQANKLKNVNQKIFAKRETDANKSNFYLLKNARRLDFYVKYIFVSGIFYIILPAIASIVLYFKDGEWLALYPTELWIPFEATYYYIPIYVLQMFAILNFMFLIVGSEAMILMIMVHIIHQFIHIARELEGMTEYDRKMKTLIDKHCRMSE